MQSELVTRDGRFEASLLHRLRETVQASKLHLMWFSTEEREKRRLARITQPSYRPAQVAVILEELRRRTEEMSRRSESLSARAGILVASAALIAALQDGRGTGPLILGAVVLALFAAGAGISAIFPSVIRYPTIDDTRREIFARGDVEDGQWWLIDRLTEQYADSAEHVKRRGTLLRLGFILLGLSIVLTAIAVAQTSGEVT